MFSSSVPVPGRRLEIGQKFWRILVRSSGGGDRNQSYGSYQTSTSRHLASTIRQNLLSTCFNFKYLQIHPHDIIIFDLFLQWMARRRRHSWGAKSAGSNFVTTLGKKQESVQKCDGKQIPCQHSVWRSDRQLLLRQISLDYGSDETSFWYWLIHILDDFDEVCVEFWEFSLCIQQTEYLNCSHSYSRILTLLHNVMV